jgi:hypothetical protein
LGLLAVETKTAVYAWALMSNHAHLLVCSGAEGLAKFMRRLLTGYAEGVRLGRRPELVMGSGSVGEWFVVKSYRPTQD